MARSTLANGAAALDPEVEGLAAESFAAPEPDGAMPPLATGPDAIAATPELAVVAPEASAPMIPVTGGVSGVTVAVELSPPESGCFGSWTLTPIIVSAMSHQESSNTHREDPLAAAPGIDLTS